MATNFNTHRRTFARCSQCEAIEATADCVEACFRRHTKQASPLPPVRAEGPDSSTSAEGAPPPPAAAAATVNQQQQQKPVTPSSQAFDEDVAGPLATAVIRSLRFFRAAAAGTEAASVPAQGGEGEQRQPGEGFQQQQHTPAVTVLPDGSVAVDDGHRRVALAGLRLAGAAATAPGPARALLAAGAFHVLWRLPLDPAATPMGVALALGALCQGLRHAEVLRVFLARWDGGETASGSDGPGAAAGLATLGGYEACASVLSRPVRLGEGRERAWGGTGEGEGEQEEMGFIVSFSFVDYSGLFR